MADSAGQAEIRGLNIQKVAVAYLDQALVFRQFLRQTTTSAREIRWYQKTAGPLTPTSPATLKVAEGALPSILRSSATRNTSYVIAYKVDSDMISYEDLSDNDINIWDMNLRDLTQSIAYQMDLDIWNVLTENQTAVNINSVTTTAAWDTASYTNVNIVDDLMEAKQDIYVNSGFSAEGAILAVNSQDMRAIMNWFVDGIGTKVPQFASGKVVSGQITEIAGLRVVISENVTADKAAVFLPDVAATWYSFKPLQTAFIDEPLVGRKMRLAEEGIATLDRPKCVALIANTRA